MSRIKDLLPDVEIKTYYDPPPIPMRDFDWAAIDIRTYGGEPSDPIGFGKTKNAAIKELVNQLLDLIGD